MRFADRLWACNLLRVCDDGAANLQALIKMDLAMRRTSAAAARARAAARSAPSARTSSRAARRWRRCRAATPSTSPASASGCSARPPAPCACPPPPPPTHTHQPTSADMCFPHLVCKPPAVQYVVLMNLRAPWRCWQSTVCFEPRDEQWHDPPQSREAAARGANLLRNVQFVRVIFLLQSKGKTH